jgi:FkbM family methyltransferase
MREWWPYMSLGSLLRLREYERRSAKGDLGKGATLALDMKRPVKGLVSLREAGSDMLTFDEVFKSEIYRGVVSQVSQCDTIIDLGANIGLASLYFAAHYPSCRILAIEPNPDTYQLLTTNLSKLIQSGHCQTVQAAVWGSETVLTGDSDSPGHYSAFETRQADETTTSDMQIAGLPITRLIASSGFDRIDLLKVDIEGAEVELFKGDLNWLRKVKSIAIEFHHDSREKSSFDRVMREYGFGIVDEGSHTVLALNKA